MAGTETYALAYDVKLRQPGCVLLQAIMGGTVPSRLFHRYFDNSTWLFGSTDDMKLYRVTDADLKVIAAKTRPRRVA